MDKSKQRQKYMRKVRTMYRNSESKELFEVWLFKYTQACKILDYELSVEYNTFTKLWVKIIGYNTPSGVMLIAKNLYSPYNCDYVFLSNGNGLHILLESDKLITKLMNNRKLKAKK